MFRPRTVTMFDARGYALGDNRGVGDLGAVLRRAGAGPGDLAGLVVAADGTGAVATADGESGVDVAEIARADQEVRPRWVTWSQETAQRLVARDVRLATCWDVAAVHRLLFGGWRADPACVLACLHGTPPDEIAPAASGEPDLFSAAGLFGDGAELDDREPFGAAEALAAARLQLALLAGQGLAGPGLTGPGPAGPGPAGPGEGIAVGTARSESTAELLCAELAADGLPVDRTAAEQLLGGIIGPRPRGAADAIAIRTARDERVLAHAPAGVTADLRSPAQVRTLLAAAGVDVPDTRAWRLEEHRERSPLVAALLDWRKAERIATTYGYGWLDEHLGADGRLRGTWTGSDGAAGRMTASSGLHNMPAVLRQAVCAADGHLLVRADLGQIEPRMLAAVSGDTALAAATAADDLYLPVAAELGVDRPTAKVAMIAAMYGQTTGHGGEAGRRMRASYPVAMAYLDTGDRSARAGIDLRTYGGRRIRMSNGDGTGAAGALAALSAAGESQAKKAARGRYGRNALIQGAAAELFKMWAVTVRARGAPLGARIVLCLHDELLVHVPAARAQETADMVASCLAETVRRWAPGGRVRFIADISVLRRWADAKA
jgi:DNA polymerase-1